MRVLFIETFYGGSHRIFADQWITHSRHNHHLITLPARFWKWRQAGAAIYLAGFIAKTGIEDYDVMVVSGMIDLAHLKILRPDLPPAMLYMHENQFAYPMKIGETRDFRYGITDLMNILSAETVVFNSAFNRDTLLNECRILFNRLPDAIPGWTLEKACDKSRIVYPGIDTEAINRPSNFSEPVKTNEPPLIIWNHRHEHDKDPNTAFKVLESLRHRNIPFSLAILGERYAKTPPAFDRARKKLADRIVVDAFPPRDEYVHWLKRGDIVISAALQENFGLSVIEAACAGCWPILPNRLAYPEVMPNWVRGACLWNNEKDFESRLEKVLKLSADRRVKLTGPLSRWLKRYNWKYQTGKLDDIVVETAVI